MPLFSSSKNPSSELLLHNVLGPQNSIPSPASLKILQIWNTCHVIRDIQPPTQQNRGAKHRKEFIRVFCSERFAPRPERKTYFFYIKTFYKLMSHSGQTSFVVSSDHFLLSRPFILYSLRVFTKFLFFFLSISLKKNILFFFT